MCAFKKKLCSEIKNLICKNLILKIWFFDFYPIKFNLVLAVAEFLLMRKNFNFDRHAKLRTNLLFLIIFFIFSTI